MRKTIIIYALTLAVLTATLKVLEFRFFVRDLSLEFYLGLIAFLFTALGIWAGLKLTKRKFLLPLSTEEFAMDTANLQQAGLSKRELEVLDLIAQGLSNQEVADKLYVSPNTVKTHLSNVFLKLDVKRRTQAVQKAKELRLIP